MADDLSIPATALQAESVSVAVCVHGQLHILFYDDQDQIIAFAPMPPLTAADMAKDFAECLEEALVIVSGGRN